MAGNPRTVTEDRWITWDGVTQRLPKGQAIDVAPGSALESAIGKDKLVPLGPTSALPPAEEAAAPGNIAAKITGAMDAAGIFAKESAPQDKPDAAPAKPVAPVKKQDAATDGKSSASAKDGNS